MSELCTLIREVVRKRRRTNAVKLSEMPKRVEFSGQTADPNGNRENKEFVREVSCL